MKKRPSSDPRFVRALLFVVDRFLPLFRLAGVDPKTFRPLLRTKFLLESRRPKEVGSGVGLIQQGGFALLIGIYLVTSFGLGAVATLIDSPLGFVTLCMTTSAVMTLFPLITDFSHILVDTADLSILSPLIPDRSLVATRYVHIAVYLTLILGSLAPGPVILGSFATSSLLFAPIYLSCLAITGFSLLLCVVFLYLVVLRTVDTSRFKDALIYVQIGIVILFYGGFQILPRVLPLLPILHWIEEHPALMLLFPPAWFGGLIELCLGSGETLHLALAGCIPIGLLGLFLIVRAVSGGGIMARLYSLAETGEPRKPRKRRGGVSAWLADRMNLSPLVRAGFDFVVVNASTDRSFKMRTWPTAAIIIVAMISLTMVGGGDGEGRAAKFFPFYIYIPLFLLMGAVGNSSFSDHYSGNWCFQGLEKDGRSAFVRGGMHGLLVRYLLVPQAVFLPFLVVLSGVKGLPDLLFAILSSWASGFLLIPPLGTVIPFTRKFGQSAINTNMGLMMLMGIIPLVSIGIQVGLGFLPFGVLAGAGALCPVTLFAFRSYRNSSYRVQPIV